MRKYWNDREGAPLKCDSYGGLLYCCVEEVPGIKQCAPGKTHGSDYSGKSTGMCTRIFGRCAKSTKYKTVCTEDDSWVRLQRKEYWDVYETIWKVRKARFLGALLQ